MDSGPFAAVLFVVCALAMMAAAFVGWCVGCLRSWWQNRSQKARERRMNLTTCIGCGCDDLRGCWDEERGNPCIWLREDLIIVPGRRPPRLGVCSACPELVEAWDAGDRQLRVPIDFALEEDD